MYLNNIETRRNREGRNADSNGRGVDGGLSIFASLGHSKGQKKRIRLNEKNWEQCRKTVLFNCNECQPYLQQCLDEVKQNNRRRTMRELETLRNNIFPTWFKKRVNDLYEAKDPSITEDLRWYNLKQMIQSQQSTPPSHQLSQPLHQPILQMPSYPTQSQQSAPPSQQSSQPLHQPFLQMSSYPPQMYWPQVPGYPQMPYQPQHLTTGLTGLLMGDTSVQENELLNQLRASSNQSSRGSE